MTDDNSADGEQASGLEGDPVPSNFAQEQAGVDVVAQPGGFAVAVGGKPIAEVAQVIARASDALAQDGGVSWLAPLLMAALHRPYQPGGVRAITAYGDDLLGHQDEEKHKAYVAHVRSTVEGMHPWLWSLFENAGASVLATPGCFAFSLPNHQDSLGASFEVPTLSKLTHLTPFVEPQETAH